jgi:hypothetical protein
MVTWDEEVPPGQYVFPFNFKLPVFCPSTFYYSGEDLQGNYVKAEVFYYVSVKLIISGDESKLSHSRIINIKNMMALEKPGSCSEETPIIRGCCFSNKGSTSFKLSVENKEHCLVDGAVNYKLFPNNGNCKAPINRVIASIVIECLFNTSKGEFKVSRSISEIDRSTWISAFTSLIYERDFEYLTELKVYSDELNPSSNRSSLISCEYFAEVKVFYDLSCMKNPVVMRLPFHVNPKAMFRKEEPKLPGQWDPLESTIFSFAVETAGNRFSGGMN